MSSPVQYAQPAATSPQALAPQVAAPATAVSSTDPPTGVDRSKGVGSHTALVVGDAVEPAPSQRVGALDLPDDSAKPYITVVGDKKFRDDAMKQIGKAGLNDSFHVVSYAPDDFQAKDAGYDSGVWVTNRREKDGTAKVISFDPTLDDIQKQLDTLNEAIRKDGGILDKLKLPKLVDAINPRKIIADKVNGIIGPMLAAAAFAALGLAVLWR